MKVIVIKGYEQPYENPISVKAGSYLIPNFKEVTNIPGWVWCTAEDGRAGWVPKNSIESIDGRYKINRDFNAIELTISPGERLEVLEEESHFYWAITSEGQTGWIPVECVSPINAVKLNELLEV